MRRPFQVALFAPAARGPSATVCTTAPAAFRTSSCTAVAAAFRVKSTRAPSSTPSPLGLKRAVLPVWLTNGDSRVTVGAGRGASMAVPDWLPAIQAMSGNSALGHSLKPYCTRYH